MASVAAPRKARRVTAPPPAPPAPPPRPIGKYERLCWERHERDLQLAYPDGIPKHARQTQHPRGLWFDQAAGERMAAFIEGFCRHNKGEWAGQLIKLSDIHRRILVCVFGWMRADGTRRFRIAWIELPRKNAKSTIAAGVGVYLTVADHEPGAEVYATATKMKQAKIVHDAAKSMVKASPMLRRFLRPLTNNISCARMDAKFEPLGSDSERLDGLNAHGHIPDEVHAHKDRGVWDVVETSKGARRQPLTFAITTAGVYDPESIGWEMHDYSIKVLEGIVEDDAHFALICAADEGDDWKHPQTWAKANPMLGISIKESYLAEQCRAAQERPSFLNTFLQKHLNIWTAQVKRWIPPEKWDACAVEPKPLLGRQAWGGLDLSTKLDIAAFAACAADVVTIDGKAVTHWDWLFRFWVPEVLVLEREQKHARPSYKAWVDAGVLCATPGNVIDYDFIKRDIVGLTKTIKLQQIGFDPWNATQLAIQLMAELNPSNDEKGFQMVDVRQGMKSLSEPAKEWEKLIVDGKHRHGGQAVMRWMVSNVAIRKDANDNIAPDKLTSKGKIDGVLASLMALGRAITTPPKPTSVYERRGMLEVPV